MSGGSHVLFSLKIFNKTIHEADQDEVEKEAERLKAMCFLFKADESRYRNLLEELKKIVYKGQDEYPTTIADAYQLLLRTSKLIKYKKSQRFGQRGRSRSAHENQNFVLAQKRANEKKTQFRCGSRQEWCDTC